MSDGGLISISCAQKENTVVIRVENPLNENLHKEKSHKGNHLAQSNTKERLSRFYNQKNLLNVYQSEQKYIVEVTIPI